MRTSWRSLATLVLALSAIPCVWAAAAPVFIYNFDGRASLIRDRRTLPADLDMPLRPGDLIRSEPDSFVDVSLHGRYGFRILADSRCLLKDIGESDVELFLDSGSMLVNLKSLESGSSFAVDTPAATARCSKGLVSVKLFEVAGEKILGSEFSVRKGRMSVYVKEASATITVLEGHSLRVAPGTYLTPAQPSDEGQTQFANSAGSVYISDI